MSSTRYNQSSPPIQPSESLASDSTEDPKKKYAGGWITLMQHAAVVTVFFAGISAQLLGIIKSDQAGNWQTRHPRAVDLLLVTSYAAVIFNASATVVSFILIDELAPLPLCWSPNSWYTGLKEGRKLDARGLWDFLFWHWMVSLLLGASCIFVQILIYVCLRESTAVKCTVAVAVFYGVVAPAVYLIPSTIRRRPSVTNVG